MPRTTKVTAPASSTDMAAENHGVQDAQMDLSIINYEALRTPQTEALKKIAEAARSANGPVNIKGLTVGAEVGRLVSVNLMDLYFEAGLNSREYDTDVFRQGIVEFAYFIDANKVPGILDIFLKEGKCYISDGHRRYLSTLYAVQYLGNDTRSLTCRFVAGESELDRLDKQIMLNSSVPLTPYEQGTLAKKYLDRGLTIVEVSKRWGRSRTHVDNCLGLHEAPLEVQTMVKEGTVTSNVATMQLKASKKDGSSPVEKLKEGIAHSKSVGAKRTSTKHIKAASLAKGGNSNPKPNLKKEAANAFRYAEMTKIKDSDDVMVKLNGRDYRSFLKLIDLDH